MDVVKNINAIYASKFLSILDYNRQNNNENIQYYHRDLDKNNRKYIEYEIIKLFFEENKKNNYENVIQIYNDNNMNIIFILILIKNNIKSNLLYNLLILVLFQYIYKLSFDVGKININVIDNNDNSNDKNISIFIKYFFGILMQKRNEIKNNFTPEELKYIILDNIIKEIKLNSFEGKINFNINEYNNNSEIIKLMEKRNENIINFILLENIIFILNYYSYIKSRDEKFLLNLFGLIKMSIRFLSKN